MTALNIILLGAPGSGKGTQAEQLCKQLELVHVSTGDIFRENLKNKTELGQLAQTYMNEGKLVPDDVTANMVRDRLAKPDVQKGFVLDGFPRTLPQAESLTDILNKLNSQIKAVIYIKVADEEIVSRLSGRRICRSCQKPYHVIFSPAAKEGVCDTCGGELYQRDDDNPTTVRARLTTYHQQTSPLVEYYTKAGLVVEIEGQGPVAEVIDRTLTAARQAAAK